MPTRGLARFHDAVLDLAADLRAHEANHDLEPLRDLDAGFVGPAWRWAIGSDLDDALAGRDMTGGDFVRNVKQVADLVGQVRGAAPHLWSVADTALDGLRRGIVEA